MRAIGWEVYALGSWSLSILQKTNNHMPTGKKWRKTRKRQAKLQIRGKKILKRKKPARKSNEQGAINNAAKLSNNYYSGRLKQLKQKMCSGYQRQGTETQKQRQAGREQCLEGIFGSDQASDAGTLAFQQASCWWWWMGVIRYLGIFPPNIGRPPRQN